MRYAVTVPDEHANSGLPVPATTTSSPATPIDGSGPSTPQPAEESAYGVPTFYQPVRKPATDSASNPQKRTDPFQFGSRYLEEGDDIFAYNAWDHVEVDDAYKDFITAQTELQRANPVSDHDKKRFNDKPEKWWDKFYSNNQANFFKDRKWLGQEFPLLVEATKEDYGPVTILEVGAGAGNTAFPILAMNKNEKLKLVACDYSKQAVEVMRRSDLYDQRFMAAEVWDLAGEGDAAVPPGLAPQSVDIVIMVFVFSALEPRQWAQALRNVWNLLKPGGQVLFRDYGRGDLAQVRFKKSRYLDENFYVRGDGTRVYFFEEEELRKIWSGSEASTDEVNAVSEKIRDTALNDSGPNSHPRDTERTSFQITNLGVDRRMLVNRQRRLKMYRCWMQGLFQKSVAEG
ncbi:putative actin-binding protein ABP140 [Elsinoe ampelina]|uniref:tRNA N(3)-methylcytidine methyltransferase n=1 Tax=Elsinoe ampelina TaxID=302913 RepID=A0A6A6GAF1_9PEZI|nr:putative actin-binding protein ABP140 [Elsinoe ampelina]